MFVACNKTIMPTKAMNDAATPTTTHRVLVFDIGYAGSLDDGSMNEPDDRACPVKLRGVPRMPADESDPAFWPKPSGTGSLGRSLCRALDPICRVLKRDLLTDYLLNR